MKIKYGVNMNNLNRICEVCFYDCENLSSTDSFYKFF